MLALLSAVPAAAADGPIAQLPDGRRLAFHCSGTGAPTILLESGWGADARAWGRVVPLVARAHRVCAYDRAGAGLSDPGPLPRDGARIAADLDAGLRAARIAGPFVVVGHSAGGLYIRLFADRRPSDVVGMVLVDPSVEHQDQRLAAVFGPGAGSTDGLRARVAACLTDRTEPRCARQPAATWAAQMSELDNLWTTTSDAVASGRALYGAMPLIVLTAGATYAATPEPARSAITAVWAGFHDAIAARSTRGVRRTVAGSGHLMMRDRPDAVAAAIDEVVAAASAPLGTPRPIG